MTSLRVLLWYVMAVHLLASGFYLVRWWRRRQRRLPGHQLTGLFAYLAFGPGMGAARELGVIRAHFSVALSVVSAVMGTLLLLFIWEAHLKRGHP